ncbi:histidinol-phosphate transaminase [Amycolatopsis acidiphila]|uniref:Aromatic amino acid aminotransferase n=1 Tax=Amycolatopsis acidiphila TaxID=715473 RepID=A0A558A823_9PSEU|nr:histidinol-phosphate transaminase [Amycolatopsis acidiphila]TVT20407.1 histidinol-phosphate transaminase [Amycolatopsis acidiphila]UIJ59205.1 histidinol-phosphate transaminase [Amycolatopsis acidiphila]GHG79115.1 putative phenylalanine aminotransferase [Amycolatopsis acidiphila]
MYPRIRAALDDVPAYVPGKATAGLVKLSSNENPFPPLPGVLERATAAAATLHRYPDLAATELTGELARFLSVPPEFIAVGTGSVGVLQQIVQTVASVGDEVVYPWRSFEAYPITTRIAGAAAVEVPLDSAARLDLAALADAVTERTKLVLVCSPNNPTGPGVRRDEFAELLARVPEDVLVVLDEAYVEFIRDPDAVNGLDFLAAYPNLCLLRTFSKAYGLAGLRIGFALAHPPVAAAIRKCAVPFGVSTIAQLAAIESLHCQDAMRERVDAVVAERTRVRDALLEQGWAVPETEANFVWLPTGARTARFAATCQQSGLLVRPFAPDGCRVSIAEREENDLFLRTALTQV